MNKKGQVLDHPVLAVFIVIVGLILISPIVLKVVLSIQAPMSNSLGNITAGGTVAQSNFNSVLSTVVTFWDKLIIFAFIVAVLICLYLRF